MSGRSHARGLRRAAVAIALAFAGAARVRAQDVDEIPLELLARMQQAEAGVEGGGAPEGGASAKPAQESERAKRLKTLVFDRRPSTILETWSRPPAPEPDAPAAAAPPESAPDEAAPPETAAPESAPRGDDGTAPSAEKAAEHAAEPAAADETPEARAQREAAAAEQTAQAEAAAKAKAEAARKAEEARALAREIARFQRDVTLGQWGAVGAYLRSLPEADAKVGYAQLLRSLQQGPPPKTPQFQQLQQWFEKNQIDASDLLGLMLASPHALADEQDRILGALLVQSIAAGSVPERFLELARAEVARDGTPLRARDVARVLHAAQQAEAMAEFLPTPEQAVAEDDREGLNLLSRYCLAMHAKDAKGG